MASHLELLGSPSIHLDEHTPARRSAQRSRLALLALLARADRRTLSRDKLIGVLWPEHDEESARHLLREAVHVIRKELGREVLVSTGDDLRLETHALRVDTIAFDDAVSRADHEVAVGLYGGPFLDGFHLKDAVEFERWAETERQRLASRYARSLEALAEAAEARREPAAAAGWWRRLTEHDPWSSPYAHGLMRSLVESGDPGGALRHADAHAAVLQTELGTSPDPAVLELADRLRSSPGPPGAAMVRTPRADRGVGGVRVAARVTPARTPTARGRPPSTNRRAVVAAILVGIILAAGGLRIAVGRGGGPSGGVDRIAILPFVVRGGAGDVYLGEGMADVLAVKLDLPGEIQTVDARAVLAAVEETPEAVGDPQAASPVARDLKANGFVLGTIVRTGDRLELEATLYGPRGERRARAAAAGDEQGLPRAIDRLARELLAVRYGRPADRLTRSAALTTESLPALRAYLEGERALRAGRFEVALDEFRRATAFDRGFALAYYRLSVAANWVGDPAAVRSALERARQLRDRLPERDRLLLDARYAAFVEGDLFRAERILRDLVARYPDELEALYELADWHFHNPIEWGLQPADLRRDFERVLALQPDHAEAILHLARIAAWEGRPAAIDSLTRRGLAIQPGGEYGIELRALRAFSVGGASDRQRALADFSRLDDEALARLAGRIPSFTLALESTSPVYDLFTREERPPWLRAMGYVGLAEIEAARGRFRRARALLEQAAPLDARHALMTRAHLATLGSVPVAAEELDRTRRMLEGPVGLEPPPHGGLWGWAYAPAHMSRLLAGLVAVRQGDVRGALDHAAAFAEAAAAGDPQGLVASAALVRAAVEQRQGRAPSALRALGSGESVVAAEMAGYEAWLRGEIHRAMDQDGEAVRWYGTHPLGSARALPSVAPAELRMAELLDGMGRSEEAARHYARFLRLWREADPELQPLVTRARARLRALEAAPEEAR